MDFDVRLYERAACAEEDRVRLLPLLRRIIEFSLQARREGLLGLEDRLNEISDPFFKRNLMLIIDGTDPAYIEHIVKTELYTGELKGAALLEKLMTADGIFQIQRGTDSRLIEYILLAYLGDRAAAEYRDNPVPLKEE